MPSLWGSGFGRSHRPPRKGLRPLLTADPEFVRGKLRESTSHLVSVRNERSGGEKVKRQAEGVPPGQAAAFGTADVSTNTELKSSDFGGKRCFWKRPRLHDDIRDSGKGERTARAQQGESASGRPLAKGACPGVGRTGARPKRGRRLDGARDPRRPENPRLPHVGSSPGKAGTRGVAGRRCRARQSDRFLPGGGRRGGVSGGRFASAPG